MKIQPCMTFYFSIRYTSKIFLSEILINLIFPFNHFAFKYYIHIHLDFSTKTSIVCISM